MRKIIDKQRQEEFIKQIMKSDEELEIYNNAKYCECLAPIIRTGGKNGYCAICNKDLL